MPADMTDPKNWGIGLVLYLFFVLMIWKFQLGGGDVDLTGIRIAITIFFLPVVFGIIYVMGDD